MSAFADLIREAEALGATKLSWECDVVGFASDERAYRWTCRVSLTDTTLTVIDARGRTGEEALRGVVEFLRGIR